MKLCHVLSLVLVLAIAIIGNAPPGPGRSH